MVIETSRQGYRAHADDFKPIDLIELRVFLGLMILRGVFRAAGECTDELWWPEHGRAVFGRTMSLSRFKLICGILRFDNV